MLNKRATTLGREGRVSRSTRVCHAAASTVTPQLASQAALETRPDLLRTHMPENGQVWCHRGGGIGGFGGGWLEQPGHSGGAPREWADLSRPGSAELLIAARRAPRRRGSRASWGTAWRLQAARHSQHTRGTHAAAPPQGGATLAGAEPAVAAHCLCMGGGGGSLTVRACRLAAGCTGTSPRRRRRRRSRRSSPSMRRRTCTRACGARGSWLGLGLGLGLGVGVWDWGWDWGEG